MVADELSRKKLALVLNVMAREWELMEAFSQLTVDAVPVETSVYVASLVVQSRLVEQIRQAIMEDPRVKLWVDDQGQVKGLDFSLVDEILQFGNRIYVPKVRELRQTILNEAYRAKYTIHPSATKMYRDLRGLYW